MRNVQRSKAKQQLSVGDRYRVVVFRYVPCFDKWSPHQGLLPSHAAFRFLCVCAWMHQDLIPAPAPHVQLSAVGHDALLELILELCDGRRAMMHK